MRLPRTEGAATCRHVREAPEGAPALVRPPTDRPASTGARRPSPTARASFAAEKLYQNSRRNMMHFMKQSSHYRRLARFGVINDIKYCLRPDLTDVVPVLNDVTSFAKSSLMLVSATWSGA